MHFSAAIFAFSLACLFSLGSTPLVRRMALISRFSKLRARANGRTVHVASRPETGGLAIFFSLIAALGATAIGFADLGAGLGPLLRAILPPAAIVAGVGLYDDFRGCSPLTKILAQLAALALLQSQLDVLGFSPALASTWPLLSLLVLVPWFVGLTNAMNLIDGLDGLATGVAIISGMGLVVLGFALGDGPSATLAAALVGAALGFLRSNTHPAKVFLGDSGSMLLGFVLATVGARFLGQHQHASIFLALVLISWVPCLDALYAVLRRAAKGVSIFRPDQGHIHHRLLRAGVSTRWAGGALWGLSLLSATAGVMVALGQHASTWAAAVIVATLPLVWLLRPAAIRRDNVAPTAAPAPASRGVVSQNRAA